MENNLILTEKHYVQVFEEMKKINDLKKEIEARETLLREEIKKACEKNGIKSFKNDVVTISYVEEKRTVSVNAEELKKIEPELYKDLVEEYPIEGIDFKKLEAKEPVLYHELLSDYPKEKVTSGYIKLTYK